MVRFETRLVRSGKTVWSDVQDLGSEVEIECMPLDTAMFRNISNGHSVSSSACIYCGSRSNLTKEHVIPYGLNGTATIANGSCEECQKVTHKFEAAILRGELQNLRYRLQMSSRSKHKSVKPDPRSEEASAIRAFPIYPLPNYLGDRPGNGLKVERMQIVADDRGELAGRRVEHTMRPVEFAKMVAKIAYCYAWSSKLIQVVDSASDLINAFMTDSGELGRFVGTRRPPFKKFPGSQHILKYGCISDRRVVYVDVQLFSDKGAPTYIVALGDLKQGWSFGAGRSL